MTHAFATVEAIYALPLTPGAAIPWRYLAASHHEADWLNATGEVIAEATFGADFTITPSGDTAVNGGVISLPDAPPATATQLRLRRSTPPEQYYAATPGAEGVATQLDRYSLWAEEQLDIMATLTDPAGDAAAANASAIDAAAAASAAAASLAAAAALAATSSVPVFASRAALALASVIVDTVLVGGVLYQANSTGPAPDLTGRRFGPAWFVTPRMFGAVGDAVANDRTALQAAWDYASANNIPCLMEGLQYNCSADLLTRSNLTVMGGACVLYNTSWAASGGFVNNLTPDVPGRVQTNIHLENIIFDGSKLPAPVGQNTNLCGFARGVSRVRVVNCVGRYMRDGDGGGTGGAAFGVEQGASDVQFLGCTAHDCYRGFRVAGLTGVFADTGAQSKRTINITVRDFTARNCGTAILAHSVGDDNDDQSDLSVFDTVFDGVFIENCGHYPWRAMDYVLYPVVAPQKTGAIVLGGAQNVRFRGIRVRLDAGFTDAADWLGRVGYPGAGTNYTGAGLNGFVGALVWGWGRNVVFEDITLDGSVDVLWKCARAITFGDLASVDPTFSTGTVSQVVFENIRHVRPGVYFYVFDGQAGLINGDMSAVINVVPSANPTIGVIGPNGTASLTNVLIRLTNNIGNTQEGNCVEWLAAGNQRPAAPERRHSKAGFDFGGGYSSTGLRRGVSFDSVDGVLRSSQNSPADSYQLGLYNPNGLCGGLTTNGQYVRLMLSPSVWIMPGLGSPEGVVTAAVGCMFLRLDGGAGTTLYVKQSGAGSTGWAAK